MTDAAPYLDLPDTGPASPAAERLSRAHEVSAELEAIFGDATPAGRALAPSPVRAQPPRRPTMSEAAPRRVNLASVGGVLAAALVGVAAGSLLGRAQHAKAPNIAAIAPPSYPASLPVQVLPPIQPPQAIDAALMTQTAIEETPVKAAAKPHIVRSHVRAAHRLRTTAHACCSNAEVQTADRRLRAAYANAVRAGVSRGEIASARSRWSAARSHAGHDPARVVASYRDIADDLDRATWRAHSYAREDHGRFHPRYAAWWR